MALTPEVLDTKIVERQRPLIDSLEQKIDEALVEKTMTNPTLYLSKEMEQLLYQLGEPSRKHLFDRYRNAGWNVELDNNQRDGTMLEFRRKEGFWQDEYGL